MIKIPVSQPIPKVAGEAMRAISSASRLTADQLIMRGFSVRIIVTIVETGVVVYTSSEFSNWELLRSYSATLALNFGIQFRIDLSYTYYTGTVRVYSASVKLRFNKSRVSGDAGKTTFLVALSGTERRDIRLRLISAVERLRKPNRQLSTRYPRSTTLRANPEIQTANHLRAWIGEDGTIRALASIPITVHSRSWTGTRTPGFGKLRSRVLPINNHSVDMHDTVDGGQLWLSQRTTVPGVSFDLSPWTSLIGTGSCTGPTSIGHLPAARNKAIAKLSERADASLSANLAQDFAQYGQTTKLITKSLGRITGAISALKKGKYKLMENMLWGAKKPVYRKGGGPSPTKTLAENWLEVQYGWKPALKDIQDSMRILTEYFKAPTTVVRTAKAGSRVEQMTRVILTYNSISIGVFVEKTITNHSFGIRYKVDDKLKSLLSQTGFTNPLNLAWEVLPYSFVADWALPIGPWLESLSSYEGLSFIDGWETQFTRKNSIGTVSYSGKPNPISDPNFSLSIDGSYGRERILLNRVKITSFPKAQFPSLKNPFSATHVLNGLALLRAAFR